MELIPTGDEYHLLVGLEEETVVTPKKKAKRLLIKVKMASRKVIEEVTKRGEKNSSSSKFDDIFELTLLSHQQEAVGCEPYESSKLLEN